MGAIADGFVAFAQPLLDQTDGSLEQMQEAFAMSQLCFNLALLEDNSRDSMFCEMRASLKMSDEEFDDFRRSTIDPMIQRHREMFPLMHRRASIDSSQSGPSTREDGRRAGRAERYPGTPRYAPCPCQSGEKYKFCCGAKRD
jgi:hypothetical protein